MQRLWSSQLSKQNTELNLVPLDLTACHDKSIHTFWPCCMCLLVMGSECGWGLGKYSNFQLVRQPPHWFLGHSEAEGAVWCQPLLPIYSFSWFRVCHTGTSYLKNFVLILSSSISFKAVPSYGAGGATAPPEKLASEYNKILFVLSC